MVEPTDFFLPISCGILGSRAGQIFGYGRSRTGTGRRPHQVENLSMRSRALGILNPLLSVSQERKFPASLAARVKVSFDLASPQEFLGHWRFDIANNPITYIDAITHGSRHQLPSTAWARHCCGHSACQVHYRYRLDKCRTPAERALGISDLAQQLP